MRMMSPQKPSVVSSRIDVLYADRMPSKIIDQM